MSTICPLADLRDLRPPPVRATLNVITHWSCRFGAEYEGFMLSLAERLPHGLHGLPWYLRWMVLVYSPAREAVMFRRNMLGSADAVAAFSRHLRPDSAEVLAMEISRPGIERRLDVYALSIYDSLVRQERFAEAQSWLSGHGTRMAGEFLGVPFFRTVLTPYTEHTLWKLANSPCAP